MIVAGIILLAIGILAKTGIVWTTGFVVLVPGLIARLLDMTGHGIGGRRARRLRAAPARHRGFPASRPRRGSGRHRFGN